MLVAISTLFCSVVYMKKKKAERSKNRKKICDNNAEPIIVHVSLRFSSNSEANASELLENLEEMNKCLHEIYQEIPHP